MKTPHRFLGIVSALVAFGGGSVSGQVANQPAAAARDGSVVTLSPFEVTTVRDVGYESLNANSISGLNTSLLSR